VKKLLKSVYIYGSYRKIKTGVSLFWTTRYILTDSDMILTRHSRRIFSFHRCSPPAPLQSAVRASRAVSRVTRPGQQLTIVTRLYCF